MSHSVHDFSVKSIDGKETPLSVYKGKLLLIVNTASNCGFTPQYKGLEELYKTHGDQVVVLGFPCNQFNKQEPGDEKAIQSFCELNFGVTFPLFSKIDVNGKNADPLYNFLKHEAPGFLGLEGIKWNFTKFLVGRDGKVIKRYGPNEKPEKIEQDLKKYL